MDKHDAEALKFSACSYKCGIEDDEPILLNFGLATLFKDPSALGIVVLTGPSGIFLSAAGLGSILLSIVGVVRHLCSLNGVQIAKFSNKMLL